MLCQESDCERAGLSGSAQVFGIVTDIDTVISAGFAADLGNVGDFKLHGSVCVISPDIVKVIIHVRALEIEFQH